jgi:hypothetical protein
VDQELLIKRYTSSALTLFSLIPSDLGRPIFDLRHRLEYNSLVADARQVLDQLIVVEREMRSVDNDQEIRALNLVIQAREAEITRLHEELSARVTDRDREAIRLN